MTEVDGVRQVEAGRAVVHQVDVGSDVVAKAEAELGIRPRVAPGVELDRGVAELEALVGDVQVLLGRRERRRRGVRRDRLAVGPEQAVDWNTEDAALEIPESDVHHAEEPDRELLGPVELPEPVPEPLSPVGALPDELLA